MQYQPKAICDSVIAVFWRKGTYNVDSICKAQIKLFSEATEKRY